MAFCLDSLPHKSRPWVLLPAGARIFLCGKKSGCHVRGGKQALTNKERTTPITPTRLPGVGWSWSLGKVEEYRQRERVVVALAARVPLLERD